ncbi:addiction module antidote protein [Bosea sp. ANAM02]|uniref:addiction module antidote protein n=1 Tax=Bosea sp. ANAM02 TaxID=2020412 RepID=UPI00140F0648|nr:addiction module antidote protein [Bosea sp. ANAM02]BCB19454.1 transcriptional regulator [Bosea sp. ANAM02]
MPLETTKFDIQDYLKTFEQQAAYIEAALEENDPAFLAKALGDVARARGMTQVARDAGVTREALYRALSETGDPRLSTFLGVLNSLGFKLRIAA